MSIKKALLFILQAALGIGLIAYFFHKMYVGGKLGDFAAAWRAAAQHWPFILAGLAAFFVCLCLCTWRWWLILRSQEIHLTAVKSLSLFFVGHFFSCFMPGATMGDVFKAVYIAQAAPTKKTQAVATVAIDRIIGLIGLIIFATIMMTARFHFFMAYPATRWALLFFAVLLGATVFFSLLLFRQNLFDRWSFFRKMRTGTPLGGIIAKAYDSFHVCMNSRRLLVQTLLISLANHLCFIFMAVLLGTSLGLSLRVIDYLSVFPVINAMAALPLTPGGTGVREATAVPMLGVLGVPAPLAISLSLMVYATTLVWGLFGGIVYLFYLAKMNKDKAVTGQTGPGAPAAEAPGPSRP